MSTKLFKEERSLFQQKINNLIKDGSDVDTINGIIRGLLNPKQDDMGAKLVEIYDRVGIDAFMDLIDIQDVYSNPLIVLPSMNFFLENIQATVIFYETVINEKDSKTKDMLCTREVSVAKIDKKIQLLKDIVSSRKADE